MTKKFSFIVLSIDLVMNLERCSTIFLSKFLSLI